MDHAAPLPLPGVARFHRGGVAGVRRRASISISRQRARDLHVVLRHQRDHFVSDFCRLVSTNTTITKPSFSHQKELTWARIIMHAQLSAIALPTANGESASRCRI